MDTSDRSPRLNIRLDPTLAQRLLDAEFHRVLPDGRIDFSRAACSEPSFKGRATSIRRLSMGLSGGRGGVPRIGVDLARMSDILLLA